MEVTWKDDIEKNSIEVEMIKRSQSLLSNANAFLKAVTLFENGEIHNDESNPIPEIEGGAVVW